MNKFLFTLALMISIFCAAPVSFAVKLENDVNVAVMELDVDSPNVLIDKNVLNSGQIASEYITDYVVNNSSFNVIDKTLMEEKIKSANINIKGIIDFKTARQLGQILGVKYIIYGNVSDITASNEKTDVKVMVVRILKNNVHTVKSHIILRIIDVDSGDILAIAKGEGKSKSSNQSIAMMILVGSTEVTQTSVHNAIKKAAIQAVDKLIKE